jgi:hypothetical protein
MIWVRVRLLSDGGLHYGQESIGKELCIWMKNDMAANMATLNWRGVLWRSSFLGNLKETRNLDNKLGLWRTLTWIKNYPSMCWFQHLEATFYMLQYIVSCSVLITCLILTRGWLCFPKSSSNLPYKCKEQNQKK